MDNRVIALEKDIDIFQKVTFDNITKEAKTLMHDFKITIPDKIDQMETDLGRLDKLYSDLNQEYRNNNNGLDFLYKNLREDLNAISKQNLQTEKEHDRSWKQVKTNIETQCKKIVTDLQKSVVEDLIRI